jgi:hypothetical protein
LKIVDDLVTYLETGNWVSFQDVTQKYAHPQNNLDLILKFFKQNDLIQIDEKKHFFRLNPNMVELTNGLKKIQSEKKIEPLTVGHSLIEKETNYTAINFATTSLIIIIGFYLVSCTLAPLANLNNQIFNLTFTIIIGFPFIFLYFKNKINEKSFRQRMKE